MRPTALLGWLSTAVLLAAGCASAPSPAPSPEAQAEAAAAAPSTRFEPAKGVVCDRRSRVCENRGGPSVGLTRLFFGEDPAAAVGPRQRAAAYPHDPLFKPNPWATCDTLVTTCYEAGAPSAELTKRYFGSNAANMLEERLRQGSASPTGLMRRGSSITCDRLSGVCYDRLGAGYGVTRTYLGEPEAELLLARLQTWRPREAPPAQPPPAPEALPGA
jgi:hypothetical protein